MKNRTVLLAVQGEGRGHMTQAISIYEILIREGYEVCCIVVGGSSNKIPDYFRKRLPVPIVALKSPRFAFSGNRRLSPVRTAISNLLSSPDFFHSTRVLHKLMCFHRPALIINFYEPLIPLYLCIFPFPGKVVSIAHQNIYLHPQFRFPKGGMGGRLSLTLYTRFLNFRADLVLAISMYDLPSSGKVKVRVIPPLLRKEIFSLGIERGDFMLAYLVNSGYIEDVIRWHESNPSLKLHCFTDSVKVRTEWKGKWEYDQNLIFHSLDDKLFMEKMACCRALATTAGFESVCEAIYLGKQVMLMPVEGHFEQYCNAMDAERIGAGVRTDRFDPDLLLSSDKTMPVLHTSDFRAWVEQAGEMVISSVETLMANGKKEEGFLASQRSEGEELQIPILTPAS